jgi:hypothetical protein
MVHDISISCVEITRSRLKMSLPSTASAQPHPPPAISTSPYCNVGQHPTTTQTFTQDIKHSNAFKAQLYRGVLCCEGGMSVQPHHSYSGKWTGTNSTSAVILLSNIMLGLWRFLDIIHKARYISPSLRRISCPAPFLLLDSLHTFVRQVW